jgi:hypothetical protein
MKQNRYRIVIVFLSVFIINSCIEPYYSSDLEQTEPLLVVDGTITDQSENQEITLSKTTDINNIFFASVKNYNIQVEDKSGNIYRFNYFNMGKYKGKIPLDKLVKGNAFKIEITSPEGKVYESNFEEMTSCADVDSVYYEFIESRYDENTQSTSMGIQYYVDLKVDKQYSKYYRWRLIETYEYHTTWPIKKYWMGRWIDNGLDYSKSVCYKTEQVKSVYSVSTQFVQDEYLKYPLIFVNNKSQRLYYKYSLLIEQCSITEQAFNYWELLKLNSQESGGMFDSQPAVVEGNIKCISNPDERVLGYFGVSSIKTKRVFAQNIEGMKFSNMFCAPDAIQRMADIYRSDPEEWPIYLVPDNESQTGDRTCFDCTKAGGVTAKPDFWDDK